MPFPGQTRSDFARSTGKGCGPLRLEAPGGGNRDARCIMPRTNFSDRRKAEVRFITLSDGLDPPPFVLGGAVLRG